MKWNQIKTLFILCFLVLDIYLLIQFLDKQKQANFDILAKQESSIEETLKSEKISLPDLPSEKLEETYIIISQKTFNEEEIKAVQDLEEQTTFLINNLIVSKFEKPVALPDGEVNKDTINTLVKSQLVYPDEYVFWDWNKKWNVLIFFQKKDGRPVYFNQSGVLIVYLNENNEMTHYTQTMLGDVESLESKSNLILPIKAIEEIYDANELYTNDAVTGVDIGYRTAVPLENGDQTFAPTWKVTVNGERNYFVNAIQGFVFSSEENKFINDSIAAILGWIKSADNDEALKEEIIEVLQRKLDTNNRSE